MIAKRSDDYRYNADLAGAEITPLASVEAFIGPLSVRVMNISAGGVALIAETEDTPLKDGDIASISIAVRERHFPVEVEVKGVRGRRMSCAFLNPPPAFQHSLQEFLQPKFLGDNIVRNKALSERPGAVELARGATQYGAFVGQNQTGFFVWTDSARNLVKIVGMSRELVFEWSRFDGRKTGRLNGKSEDDVIWNKEPEQTLLHYFADILIAWFKSEEGSRFVELLMSDDDALAGQTLQFPSV